MALALHTATALMGKLFLTRTRVPCACDAVVWRDSAGNDEAAQRARRIQELRAQLDTERAREGPLSVRSPAHATAANHAQLTGFGGCGCTPQAEMEKREQAYGDATRACKEAHEGKQSARRDLHR